MIRHKTLLRIINRSQNWHRCVQTDNLNIEKLEQESSQIDVLDEEQRRKELEIQTKRNKSRLRPAHRNILFDKRPYDEPMHWSHGTLAYNRKLYGRYGESSKVDPAYCWPIQEELDSWKEYERVAHPYTIPDMIQKAREAREKKIAERRARDLHITERMKKLDGWIKDMQDRMLKKEAEAIAAKERKEKLIEEVRRHFGYTVDPRDEKFKEMLEKKEKEQKKAMKEERKKVKEAKKLEKLTAAKVVEKPTEKTEE